MLLGWNKLPNALSSVSSGGVYHLTQNLPSSCLTPAWDTLPLSSAQLPCLSFLLCWASECLFELFS